MPDVMQPDTSDATSAGLSGGPPPGAGSLPNASQLQSTPPIAPDPSQQHRGILSDILHAVGDVLGGPTTKSVVNQQTGEIEKVPLSRGERIAHGIATGIIGAAAGAAQHGPGAAGKAGLAGAQAEQQVQQRTFENQQEESKNIQGQVLQKAQIAHQNNVQLLAQRAEDRLEGEQKAKIVDANRSFDLLTQEKGFIQPPIMVDGKDINGTPGNEAEMMKYFSDPANHQVPQGYAAMYLPQTDENGAVTHVVKLVPLNVMNQSTKMSADEFKKMTGLDAPGKDVNLTVGSALGLKSSYQESILKTAQAAEAQQKAETEKAEQPSKIAQANAEAFKAGAEGKKANAEAAMIGNAKGPDGQWNPSSLPVSLVEGNMDPTQLSKRGTTYAAALQQANQYSIEKYGKPFDIAQASSDYKYATNETTQNTLKMIQGMTEPGGAIEIAQNAAKQLPHFPSQMVNKVFNAGATELGSPEATNFHTAMLGLADEYSKVMGGGTPTDTGRQQGLDLLKAAYSKGQLAGAVDIMQHDISARQKAIVGTNRYLQKQYAPVSGPPAGATHIAPGSDGHKYYVDAQGTKLGIAP